FIRVSEKLGYEIQHLIRHAIRPCADDQSNHLRMRQRLFINRAQQLDGTIRIRRRLKIGQVIVALAVAKPHPRDALIDLPANAQPRQPAAGAETTVIAERATTDGNGAIDIRASKASVDADLLHAAAKPL